MSRLEWIKKIIIIVVGSVVAAYGITLALYAGFGGATLAVLWQGISETFHVSIGMASMIVAIIMITFAFFYDRSQIHIGTILYQIVYSCCARFIMLSELSTPITTSASFFNCTVTTQIKNTLIIILRHKL